MQKRKIRYFSILGSGRRIFNAAMPLAIALAASFAINPAHAQTLTVLYTFQGGSDGAFPNPGLLLDESGNLFGTTYWGGDATCNLIKGSMPGCGTVFELDRNGNETVLHRFHGRADGAYPAAGLVADSHGNAFGTASGGGIFQGEDCGGGCGVVFKIGRDHRDFSVVYRFQGTPDGYLPVAPLVRDADDNLYGTTTYGGSSANTNGGTVFKIDPSGNEAVLYSFDGSPDGDEPMTPLLLDSTGNLYGTTFEGGLSGCYPGCGTVFELDPSGNEIAVYRFPGGYLGDGPLSGLIADGRGNVFGTTHDGGWRRQQGTIFKLDRAGNETVVHSFHGAPSAELTADGVGNLYGAAPSGRFESIFKIDSSGRFSTLYTFTGRANTIHPTGSLVLDSAGNIYGTATGGPGTGCDGGCGGVFRLSPQ